MATITTQAGIGSFGRTLTALALATVILAGAGPVQAADSTDRITPPNPADVAILRGLLSLQHPALRSGAPGQALPASTSPALTTEPTQPAAQPAATEGEACVPSANGAPACGFAAETSARSARLANGFRDSLDRSMAAAGFDNQRL